MDEKKHPDERQIKRRAWWKLGIVATLLMLMSCGKETGEAEREPSTVGFTASLASSQTRVPIEGFSEDAPLIAEVLMAGNHGGDFAPSELKGHSTVTFTSPSSQHVHPPLYYPALPAEVSFRAFAPLGAWNAQEASGQMAVTESITGCVDLLYTDEAWKDAASQATAPQVSLRFQHALALIRVFARYKTKEDMQQWGAITDLRLSGINGNRQNLPESMMLFYATNGVYPIPVLQPQLPFYRINRSLTHPYTNKAFSGQNEMLSLNSQPLGYVMTGCPSSGLGGITVELKSTGHSTWQTPSTPIATGQAGAGKYIDIHLTLAEKGRIEYDVRVDDWNVLSQFEELTDTDWKEANAINLSAYGTANCYIVNDANASYYFDARTQGNGLSTPDESYIPNNSMKGTRALLLWSMGGDSSLGENSVVTDLHYDPKDRRISFRTADTPLPGNALIALADAQNHILWSWHIWKTNYNPYINYSETDASTVGYDTYYLSAANGNNVGVPGGIPNPLQMMKLNLGSLHTADSKNYSPSEYGLFYQWGRKDPFPAEKAAITSAIGNGSLTYAIEHPGTFMKGHQGTELNWLHQNISGLWGEIKADPGATGNATDSWGKKTCFDPCPPGWRVPPIQTWNKLKPTGSSWPQGASFLFDGISPTWYPAAGNLNGFTGFWQEAGHEGWYWSASTYQNQQELYARPFSFSSSTNLQRQSYISTSNGHNIRCCQE